MRFVIVTGMSGAGKSTALKMLEDMEYFCVDNLPVMLIEKFVQLLRDGGSGEKMCIRDRHSIILEVLILPSHPLWK